MSDTAREQRAREFFDREWMNGGLPEDWKLLAAFAEAEVARVWEEAARWCKQEAVRVSDADKPCNVSTAEKNAEHFCALGMVTAFMDSAEYFEAAALRSRSATKEAKDGKVSNV